MKVKKAKQAIAESISLPWPVELKAMHAFTGLVCSEGGRSLQVCPAHRVTQRRLLHPALQRRRACQACCWDSLTAFSGTRSTAQLPCFFPPWTVSAMIKCFGGWFLFFFFFFVFWVTSRSSLGDIYKSSLNGLFLKHEALPDKIMQTKEWRPSICPNSQSEFHHGLQRDSDLALFLQIWKTLVKL